MLGQGAERDLVHAIFWLGKAAEQGQGAAAHNLGTLYLTSESVRDPDESKKWYTLAQELGFLVAPKDWFLKGE